MKSLLLLIIFILIISVVYLSSMQENKISNKSNKNGKKVHFNNTRSERYYEKNTGEILGDGKKKI